MTCGLYLNKANCPLKKQKTKTQDRSCLFLIKTIHPLSVPISVKYKIFTEAYKYYKIQPLSHILYAPYSHRSQHHYSLTNSHLGLLAVLQHGKHIPTSETWHMLILYMDCSCPAHINITHSTFLLFSAQMSP